MKKILVVLSLICFVAVNVTNAQTSAPVAKTEKKEAAASTSSTPACSHATSKACCKKGGAKACTGDKSKAEATATEKTEAKSAVKN